MAKKLIELLFVFILLLSGCSVEKPSYFNTATYYTPDGDVFKSYTFTSTMKPRLQTRWDGRQYVYLGPVDIEGMPAAPQGWMITLETKEQK